MRLEAAVRIDFLRRERPDRPLGIGWSQARHVGQEEPGVRGHLLDGRVRRDDEQHRGVLGGDGGVEGHGRRRQAGQRRAGAVEPAARGRGFEQRPKRQ